MLLDHSLNFKIGSVTPNICYSIFYDIKEDIIEDFVYFQFLIKFYNLENQW